MEECVGRTVSRVVEVALVGERGDVQVEQSARLRVRRHERDDQPAWVLMYTYIYIGGVGVAGTVYSYADMHGGACEWYGA